jgi:hypothetical protein
MRKRAFPLISLLVVLSIQAMVIVRIVASERAARRADEARMTPIQRPNAIWQRSREQPIIRPPIEAAARAALSPEEMVIGVVAGGKARAYRLSAFEGKSGHLVNDMIGAAPVSVAYCNLTRCVRVYTNPAASAPLDIEVSGALNDEMIVKLAGHRYFQKSSQSLTPGIGPSEIPYQVLIPTLTAWKEWLMLHPDTDVYIGSGR